MKTEVNAVPAGETPRREYEAKLEPQPERLFVIRFAPKPSIFKPGVHIGALLDELRSLGTAVVEADVSGIPGIENIDPKNAYTSWNIELKTRASKLDVQSVFIFVEDDAQLDIVERLRDPHPGVY